MAFKKGIWRRTSTPRHMVRVGDGADVSTMIRTAPPFGSRNRFAAVSNEI